jgi:hypothetical protein
LRGATTTTKKTLIYLDRSLELLSPSFPSLGSKKRFSSSFLARLGWTFVVAVDASSLTISFPNTTKNETSSFFYIRACVFARRVSHCSPVQVLSSSATTDQRKEHRALATTTTTTTHNNDNNNNNDNTRDISCRRVIFFFAKNSKIFSVSFLRYFVLNFTTA